MQCPPFPPPLVVQQQIAVTSSSFLFRIGWVGEMVWWPACIFFGGGGEREEGKVRSKKCCVTQRICNLKPALN